MNYDKDKAVGKAMVQEGSAIVDECEVYAASEPNLRPDGGAFALRFARQLSVGEGQDLVLDLWQQSYRVPGVSMAGVPVPPKAPTPRPAKKETSDAE
jgi:hypothetical protein